MIKRHLEWFLASGDWDSKVDIDGRRCYVLSTVDNQAVSIWNERSNLSLKRKGEIAILAAAKYRGGDIFSPTRMKNAGLADFPTRKGTKHTSSSLKRKLNDVDDNEDWVGETMCAMALHFGPEKPRSSLLGTVTSGMKSSEGSPSGKGPSSAVRSRQTMSGKGKISTLTLDDASEPICTLAEFAAKSVTSDLASKVIGNYHIRAFDKAATFACLVSLYLHGYFSCFLLFLCICVMNNLLL
ncbi:hypothetical protein ACOSQ3_024361 [Xanthoceras sorbifolium]